MQYAAAMRRRAHSAGPTMCVGVVRARESLRVSTTLRQCGAGAVVILRMSRRAPNGERQCASRMRMLGMVQVASRDAHGPCQATHSNSA